MNAPLRALHVGAGNMYGGIESTLVTLARERGRCPAMDPGFALCFEGRLSAELSTAGTPPVILPGVRVSRPWTVWKGRAALAQSLGTHRPDVVVCHAPWVHAIFAPTVRAAGIPLVFWQHGPAAGSHWLERWAGRTPPDGVVATSAFTAATLANLFPGAAATVVHPPVSAPDSARPGRRLEIRGTLGVGDDTPVVVQVGRLEPLKGHAVLLDALARLRQLPWQCWIVGAPAASDASYLSELKSVAQAAGIAERVQFLGERTDVPQLLGAADVFCQPNTAPDAFGIVFVEALYAGLPVITSALGGAPEVVDDSCGQLVPPHDAAALAAALERLIRAPGERRRLAANGPARATQVSDPARQLERLAGVLGAAVRLRAP